MAVVLVGSNPGVLLYDGERATAFASVWQVDWSVRGAGAAIVLVVPGEVRILGDDAPLGRWLGESFTRHFPEARAVGWSDPTFVHADVRTSLDLGDGFRATAGDVVVDADGLLDRRVVEADDVTLDGAPHGLRNVLAPCANATISVGGVLLPGTPRVEVGDRPTSTAYLAVAEVWTTP